MSTKILPTNYLKYVSNNTVDAVQSVENRIYTWAGVHGDVIGAPLTPNDDTRDIEIDSFRNMIFGKRVANDDVTLMVRKD